MTSPHVVSLFTKIKRMLTYYPQLRRYVLCCTLVFSFTLFFSPTYAQSGCSGGIPQGYEPVYCLDMEADNVLDYLDEDAWYFYDNGNTNSSTGGENNTRFHDRFSIVTDPNNPSNKVMRQTLFAGDDDYSNSNPPLNPRTELSFRPSNERTVSKEIYFKIKTMFTSSDFSAEFIQFWLHGSENIPLQIEARNNEYRARVPRPGGYSGGKPLPGKKLSDYVNTWITWEIRAKFTKNNGGYWHIYMDGELVFEDVFSQGIWPTESGTWHPQFGVYSNNGSSVTKEAFFDDLVIAEYTGIIIPDETEITALALIDASNESTIPSLSNLTEETYIEKPELPNTDFNVYAETIGDVDSVTFTYDLNGDIGTRKESNPPYALKGDGVAYETWDLVVGSYSITAYAYFDGEIKSTAIANFDVVEFLPEFYPIHDAYVQGTDGFNTSDLRVESGNRTTFLMFDLSNVSGTITDAQLELYVSTDGGSGPVSIHDASHSNWTESSIDAANAPTIGLSFDTKSGDFTIGNSYSWDVTGIIGGDFLTLAVQHTGSNDVSFSSKEGSVKPKLTITMDDGIVTSNVDQTPSEALIFTPNPSNGLIKVSGQSHDGPYAIHDISGQIIQKGEFESTSLNLSHLEDGIYFIETVGNNSSKIGRVIIQH